MSGLAVVLGEHCCLSLQLACRFMNSQPPLPLLRLRDAVHMFPASLTIHILSVASFCAQKVFEAPLLGWIH